MIIQRNDFGTELPSYSEYCAAVRATFYPDREQAFSMPSILKPILGAFHEFLTNLAEEVKTDISAFVKALLSKDIFKLLSKVRFSLSRLVEFLQKAGRMVKDGILQVFETLERKGWLDKIRSGAMKIDDIINEFPILKKVTGPVIAGLLLFIWLNMTFTGDFQYDFNVGMMFDALGGKFSIYDLFATPSGLTMLTLLGTGLLTGGALSFPWLFSEKLNLLTAILYTGLVRAKETQTAKSIKQLIKNKFRAKSLSSITNDFERNIENAGNWFDELDTKSQKLYVQRHPTSKYADRIRNGSKKRNSKKGDKEIPSKKKGSDDTEMDWDESEEEAPKDKKGAKPQERPDNEEKLKQPKGNKSSPGAALEKIDALIKEGKEKRESAPKADAVPKTKAKAPQKKAGPSVSPGEALEKLKSQAPDVDSKDPDERINVPPKKVAKPIKTAQKPAAKKPVAKKPVAKKPEGKPAVPNTDAPQKSLDSADPDQRVNVKPSGNTSDQTVKKQPLQPSSQQPQQPEKPKSGLFSKFKDLLGKLGTKDKEFFASGQDQPKSEQRTAAAQIMKRKAKGIVSHLKHQAKEWKHGVSAFKKFAMRKPLTDKDKEAMHGLAVDLSLTLGAVALTGGLAGGLAAALGHISIHAIQDAAIKSVGHSIFHASAELSAAKDEEFMVRLIQYLSEYVEEGDIPEHTWEKSIRQQVDHVHQDNESHVPVTKQEEEAAYTAAGLMYWNGRWFKRDMDLSSQLLLNQDLGTTFTEVGSVTYVN
jgi:hypothetical protein